MGHLAPGNPKMRLRLSHRQPEPSCRPFRSARGDEYVFELQIYVFLVIVNSCMKVEEMMTEKSRGTYIPLTEIFVLMFFIIVYFGLLYRWKFVIEAVIMVLTLTFAFIFYILPKRN